MRDGKGPLHGKCSDQVRLARKFSTCVGRHKLFISAALSLYNALPETKKEKALHFIVCEKYLLNKF